MAFDPNQERINDLERDLYSRDAPEITAKKRPELSSREKLVQYGWKEDNKKLVSETVEAEKIERKSSFASKFFMASVLFFVVAAGIAAYIILGGFNVISSKNVDISVQGLIAVAAGEELSLDITVKNNNNSALDSGTMYIEYPEGTKMASDVTKELTRDHFEFETVPAGGTISKTVKVVLFGEKDSVKQIKVVVDYRAHGSNASFSKEKIYDVTINSSPILMTVAVPSEVNSGQEIDIKVEVASNSNTVVRDLLVRAEYPFGFTFISSTPAPSFSNNMWRIGDFGSKEKRSITLHGRMDGQNDEERTFRFTTGTADVNDERQIAVGYITAQQSLFIKKPFISLGLKLNNQSGGIVTAAGERVNAVLSWSNNLPIAISDAVITAKFSGRGLDRGQIASSAGGFFRSVDNTITWDKNSAPGLQSLEPGETGSVSFHFATLPATQQLLAQGGNRDVEIEVEVTGTRVQSGVPQNVKSTLTGLVKVGTNLDVFGMIRRLTQPFVDSGPIPPRADRETTYTVFLNASNSLNDVANTRVTTKLPPYVRWLGMSSPAGEQISYDDTTRTVTWNISDLRSGTGYVTASKQVAFQIAFLPSLGQVGSAPDLTENILITGTDRFTGLNVQSTKPPLTTRFSSDPEYETGDEIVVQ